MMMPANYSVIAENEMTYVNGGANFIDAIGAVTAPIWTLDNVKTFNTNIVTLVGNTFLQSTIDRHRCPVQRQHHLEGSRQHRQEPVRHQC